MKFIKNRVTAVVAGATVIGLLGGTAAFAHGYGDSIGSEDIRNESIYSQDIKDGQVRTGEIKDGHVFEVDLSQEVKALIAASTVGPKGDTGEQGPKGDTGDTGAVGANGPRGEQGEAGADGADGVANPETDGTYHDLAAGDGTEVVTFTVDCAGDKVATGGGFSVDFPQHRANVRFVGSTPADFTEIVGDPEGSVVAHGWEVQVINDGPATSLRTWVACATAG